MAQFLEEWDSSSAQRGKQSNVPKYNKKCLEYEFNTIMPQKLQCRGPAYPGEVKCRVADRLMNQMHNEVRV